MWGGGCEEVGVWVCVALLMILPTIKNNEVQKHANNSILIMIWVMLLFTFIYHTHVTLIDIVCFKWFILLFFKVTDIKSHISRCDMGVKNSITLMILLGRSDLSHMLYLFLHAYRTNFCIGLELLRKPAWVCAHACACQKIRLINLSVYSSTNQKKRVPIKEWAKSNLKPPEPG